MAGFGEGLRNAPPLGKDCQHRWSITMATMNVSLPEQMKAWVEQQAASGDYANASDYVRDLIRRDWERKQALAEFDSAVMKGLESGWSARTLDDIQASAKASARAAERA
jgi:antitoxin ParD1/3/4